MDIEANDLVLFARVADSGSFSRGAARAALPKSTVSRRIAALETRLGERVFLRSTRRLALTEFGVGLLEHAHRLCEEVEAACALAQYRQAQPSGKLRVSVPGDFAFLLLPAMLASICSARVSIWRSGSAICPTMQRWSRAGSARSRAGSTLRRAISISTAAPARPTISPRTAACACSRAAAMPRPGSSSATAKFGAAKYPKPSRPTRQAS
jgi:hypothetical protein